MAKTLINSICLSALLIVLLVSNGLPKAKGQCFADEGPAEACTPLAILNQQCNTDCKDMDSTYTGQCDLEALNGQLHCHCYKPCPP
ncbi:unnamed protein product [Eruca vesicaria subsp. sativa]|uniref:Uncharacterized protein n=1 Tax=Eruca vesicaria subsp. sativa TaxID=29727 RepID=A0ABC8LDG6_ERUVS|nr:unnamed protein product [Eruca vesicaria subsp. sativa]